jgi:hypothetical protein
MSLQITLAGLVGPSHVMASGTGLETAPTCYAFRVTIIPSRSSRSSRFFHHDSSVTHLSTIFVINYEEEIIVSGYFVYAFN